MKFTEEEELFKMTNDNLYCALSQYIEPWIIESFESNNKRVKTVHSFAKRILIEVAKKRDLNIDENIIFNIDVLLKNLVKMPDLVELNKEEFISKEWQIYVETTKELKEKFDVLYYKDYEAFKKFIDEKVKGKNYKELDTISDFFCGKCGVNDSFREFHKKYIWKLFDSIDMLYIEGCGALECLEKQDIVVKTEDFVLDTIEEKQNETKDWVLDDGIKENKNENDKWIEVSCVEINSCLNATLAEVKKINKIKKLSKITDDELIDLLKYINTFSLVNEYQRNGIKIGNYLNDLRDKTKLKEFYSNREFFQDFKKIMEHDKSKHSYLFHGTQDLISAGSIIQEGLGMMKCHLKTTTCSEMSMDEVILYRRSFGNEIGDSAVVIIDNPKNDEGELENIVEVLPKDFKIHFFPSGLQGCNGKPEFIVNTKFIVGYVDKVNKQIIFNPRYYGYDKLKKQSVSDRPTELPYSLERMAEAIERFDSRELEQQINQLDK